MKKYIYNLTAIFVFLFSSLLVGCDESGQIDADDIKGSVMEPLIESFQPSSGSSGTEVMLIGKNFATVESVYIGNQLATIKNRISNTELLIEVSALSQSGKISVKNPKGEGTSHNDFTVSVLLPSIEQVAATVSGELTIGETATIAGGNLKSVAKVLVGGVEAKILFASASQLCFVVPGAEAGTSVPVVLEYIDGTESKTIESSQSYLIKRSLAAPIVTEAPASALIFTTVILKGTNMDVINHVKLGDLQVALASQSATEISFVVPSSFGVETILDIKLVFNGDSEIVGVPSFKVEVPAISSDVYFVGAMVLGAEGSAASDAKHFVSSLNGGTYYTACSTFATLDANTDFYITSYGTGGNIQLNNPNNSATQVMKFLCDGSSVPELDGKKLTNIVKFRVLNASSSVQNAYIKQVKERTLGQITPEIVKAAGISDATTSTPRSGTNFNVGDVVMFNRFNSLGTVAVSVGFMEVVDIQINADNLSASTMTVHCFFQK